jgi:hypothetical protein
MLSPVDALGLLDRRADALADAVAELDASLASEAEYKLPWVTADQPASGV